MNIGTPPGTQLDWAVKALFFPARISSMSFFMSSFAHGIRFGLVRSAIRNVGCSLVPLGTKGCAGSLTTGPGCRPGSASKYGPAPLSPTQPARFDEKSGTAALCCATVGAVGIAPVRAARTLPRRTLFRQVTKGIVVPPLAIMLSAHAFPVPYGRNYTPLRPPRHPYPFREKGNSAISPAMSVKVKICGLNSREAAEAALAAGADFGGLVFFPASPRHVSLHQARPLAELLRGRVRSVALIVDPNDPAGPEGV